MFQGCGVITTAPLEHLSQSCTFQDKSCFPHENLSASYMNADEALTLIAGVLNQRTLTNVQKLVFRHAWDGLAYDAIARATGYDPGYVKDVGAKLWRLLSDTLDEPVTKISFQAVLQRYQQRILQSELQQASTGSLLLPHQSWGDAPDVRHFYGRTLELSTLSRWLITDECRLVAILGMGGVGKTSLSVKLAEQVQEDFQYVYWRSLRDAPSYVDFLADLLRFLSHSTSLSLPESASAHLSLLTETLRTNRCLIVLDNFDALFKPGWRSGTYREGYEGYGDLLRRVGEIHHQSCWIVTSRDKPQEIGLLQGEEMPVRVLLLQGLSLADAEPLLKAKGLRGEETDIDRLIQYYHGNPLALKLTATSICDLFQGSIAAFLEQNITIFSGIRQLLKQQIKRISTLENTVMYWLAINRMPVAIPDLLTDIVPALPSPMLLEALESLRGRSLMEQTSQGFTLQPVVMEYMTNELINHCCAELVDPSLDAQRAFLQRFALLKATAKDYVRDSQIQIIVELLTQQAIEQLGSQSLLVERILQQLQQLRQQPDAGGYRAGNLINLLIHLEVDLSGLDFSHCQIRQAYLVESLLKDVSFAYADVAKTVFAETFGGISCVAYRTDGQWLATSDTSGNVQIWDVTSFRQINAFKADTVWTWAVVFAPQPPGPTITNPILATAGDDRLVRLWNPETGQCLQTLAGHTNTVNAIAFSPSGTLLASGGQDATIRLWSQDHNDTKFRACQVLTGHQGRAWSLAFTPDGTALISASEDCTLKRWNVQTGQCLQTLEGHSDWVKAVAISSDGQTIASGCFGGIIKLWHLSTGEVLQSWQGHSATVTALSFSPDGLFLASASYDQTVKVWQLATGKCIRIFTDHQNRVWSVVFSPDSHQLTSGGDDHAARLWDLHTGRCAKTWKGHTNSILSLAIEPNGQRLATGHEDQTIKLWHAQTGAVTQTLQGHTNRIWSVAFAPPTSAYEDKQHWLASGSADRTIKLWNLTTGKSLLALQGHVGWVWSVAFHPHQHWLASGSYDQSVKLWELNTGRCIRTLDSHSGPVVSVAFSPDGRWLASSSFDKAIRVYESCSGQCVQVLEGHQNSVWAVCFSANGQWLASCSYDQTIKLWDLSAEVCCQTFAGHTGPVVSLSFSEDEQYLISGSFDRSIKIWNIETGGCVQTLQGHTGLVSAIALAPASTPTPAASFWSGSFDETLKAWDLASSECYKSFRTPRPCDGLNITGVTGLKDAQRSTLIALGAISKTDK